MPGRPWRQQGQGREESRQLLSPGHISSQGTGGTCTSALPAPSPGDSGDPVPTEQQKPGVAVTAAQMNRSGSSTLLTVPDPNRGNVEISSAPEHQDKQASMMPVRRPVPESHSFIFGRNDLVSLEPGAGQWGPRRCGEHCGGSCNPGPPPEVLAQIPRPLWSCAASPPPATKRHSPSSWLWRFCGLRILSSWLGLRLEARCGSADIHVESFISKSSLLTEVSS